MVATVRLPAGGTRTVPLAAIEPSEAKRLDALPVPDLRELWKRREWIRTLAQRFKTKSEDPDRQKGSDNQQL